MLHSFRGLSCAVLMSCFGLFAQAQSDFTSAGGDGSSEAGYISFSLGQVSYQTIESNSAIISQGVQQSFGVVLKSEERNAPRNHAIIYPNPASKEVTITWEADVPENTLLRIRDIQGRILLSHTTNTNQTDIPLADLAPGVYFLEVFMNETMTQSLKFIKTHS